MSPTAEKIVYSPLGALLHVLAWLPLGALYVLSDCLYALLYHVVGYRRKIVRKNLTESFPDKSENEIKKIERDFYRHFTDYFVETIKLLHISDEEVRRRFRFENVDLIDNAFDEGRSVIIYASHYGNWEWLPSITLWTRHKPEVDAIFAQVYRPLKNGWSDRFFLNLRGRFGSRCFAKNSVFRDLVRLRRAGKPVITGFISDQHPNHNDEHHVISFLNHPTAVITGGEVIIRKLDYKALIFDLEKERRGHYKCTIRKICDDASTMPEGAITDAYARNLEQRILGAPAYWLWTHNRWKNKVQLTPTNINEDSK